MEDSSKILNNLRRQCSRREYCTKDVLAKAEKALDALKEIPLTVFDKAAQLPVFQEGLTIKLDGTATNILTKGF